MNSERIDYYEIKRDFLDYCYDGCRHKLINIARGTSGLSKDEDGIGYASYQYEGVYQLPVEQLMLAVINLILMAARGPEHVEMYHRKEIKQILSAHPLDELLKDLGEEEREDLLRDMKALQLI
ncbi:hypothetical protein [Edaphovirga cremea]|uniref:hypothetical protein n=1 Tax=Edaphovirga cremea TaxID=2267246 RepID=UPI000DEEC4B6|nr:hypothetical protein [Edaphovirga cremea]